MISFSELAGISINLPLLVFIGLGAGILSGFAGVGGAFVVTPALIILGFPANFAVGTSLAWVVGKSVIAVIAHQRLGNIDMKLGTVLVIGTMSGVEVGVRILNWTKTLGLVDVAVLSLSIGMLLIVGSYTLSEAISRKRQLDRMLAHGDRLPPAMRGTILSQRLQSLNIPPRLRFAKSGVAISLWIILVVGFFIGILAGLIGVGGGFIMVPSLVYLVGLPSFMAVGADLFQIVFSAAYGSIRHTMSGNVIIFAAVIMLVASSLGVQFGALVTRYVRGVAVRLLLGIAILFFAVGSILKLTSIVLGQVVTWLEAGSLVVTFGSLGLAVIMILVLFIIGLRYHRGQPIPGWMEALVAKAPE